MSQKNRCVSGRPAGRAAVLVAAGLALACGAEPRGEPGAGAVRRFAQGDSFFVIGTENPILRVYTYLCTSCTDASFAALEPEPPLAKSRVWTLAARSAELRKLPDDPDFLGFSHGGEHFQHDARSTAPPLLGGASFPCGFPLWSESCGAVISLQSDRTFRYAAGDTLHQLDDGIHRYVLYAVADGADLESLPLPPGWSYAARVLEHDLEVDSHGFLEAYGDVRGNLWQKLGDAQAR